MGFLVKRRQRRFGDERSIAARLSESKQFVEFRRSFFESVAEEGKSFGDDRSADQGDVSQFGTEGVAVVFLKFVNVDCRLELL